MTDPPARPGPPARRVRRSGIAVQMSLLLAGVAVITALIAGVVGTALVRNAATETARSTLAGQADVVAAQLAETGEGRRIGLGKVSQILAGQGITVARMGPRGRVQTTDDRARKVIGDAGIQPGQAVSTQTDEQGVTLLVEARPIDQGSVVLVAPLDIAAATRANLQHRVLLALGIGVVAAIAAGWIFAQLLTRPLRRTAAVAAAMGAGDRTARVVVAGPAEIAEVAASVNDLADALQRSESRQREFLTSVSHELRTPLAAIAGQADALVDGLVPGEEVQEVAAIIRAEAFRMERLVSDLMDLARLGADTFRVELQPVDLAGLVAAMAAVWQVRCRARGSPWC